MQLLPRLAILATCGMVAACADRKPTPLGTSSTSRQISSEPPAVFIPRPQGNLAPSKPGASLSPTAPSRTIVANPDGGTTLTFEGLSDLAPIGTAYTSAGITFTSGQALSMSLNSPMYPPRSGRSVVFNLSGAEVAFQFEGSASRVGGYVTSFYGIRLTCYRQDGTVVGTAAAPSPNLANWPGAVAAPNQYIEVRGSGIKTCSFAGSPNYFTIDDVTFHADARLQIEKVTTPLEGQSFTSQAAENRIDLLAKVSDPSLASQVRWKIEDDPNDGVNSGSPSAPAGLSSNFTVPAPRPAKERWPADHPGALRDKALAYRIRAYLVEGNDTTWSEPYSVRQNETDVLRQEYIDYGKATVPQRSGVGTYSTPSFSTGELNFGDYGVFLSTQELRAGIEAFRTEVKQVLENATTPFPGLTLTSAFRNPVHHHKHAGAKATESQHLYGNAADVRIHDLGFTREEMFAEMEILAKKPTVRACYEPESVVRAANTARILTHFHIDFRPSCPAGW